MPIFTFPDEPVWNEDLRALEFGVEVGEYQGRVRIPRRVFQAVLPVSPTPEACLAAFYENRSRFERAAERKIERRELSADANLDLSIADLA